MPAENIVEVHRLKKSVGQGEHELSILTGVELVVKPAETIALIGESGSGKSTLLAILAGLDDGSSGEVHLLGQPLHQLDEEARAALRARHVGFVFQSFMLIPTLNALENVELPALLRGESDRESRAQRHCIAGTARAGESASTIFRPSFPAASSSAWRWRAPLTAAPTCCLPMSPPATSTVKPATKLPTCCFRSTASTAPR